jgi:catechol 2,3-dioxygenase-like lactoylglutathione lyase family enzyme
MSHNTFHVSIYVKDIPTAVAQYQKMLGVEPEKVKADYAKFELTDPPVIFSLTLGGEPGTVSHLGIRYPGTGEVATEMVRVKNQNIPMLEQKGTTCCYAKADKFWVRDTEGMPWEFYTLLEDVEAETAADPSLRHMLEQGQAASQAGTEKPEAAEFMPSCCAPTPLVNIQTKSQAESIASKRGCC